ncbi:hypothetical protein [Corynebacterium ciconiae]|uniref:hypothetical protein n=1 Tax=Corynebacterium ciconiae TaxID=227319 RepID=UPI000477612A|nr:hypothetical protein [Corynebacterium ciconiae]
MPTLVLNCGDHPCPLDAGELVELPALPRRGDLLFLRERAAQLLPKDDTPTLAEIQARPDVEHLGSPSPAPQRPAEPWRIIVVGSDAALSAVLARLMKSDALWAEIGFVPTDADSVAARNYGIPTSPESAWRLARYGSPRPSCLIRDDKGSVVAGHATISDPENKQLVGEIIVDDAQLHHNEDRRTASRGLFGAKLVPMVEAPGIAAVRLTTALAAPRRRWFGRNTVAGDTDASSVLLGRAVQAGGPQLQVSIDSVPRPNPVEAVTFYRHLRDLQIIRL